MTIVPPFFDNGLAPALLLGTLIVGWGATRPLATCAASHAGGALVLCGKGQHPRTPRAGSPTQHERSGGLQARLDSLDLRASGSGVPSVRECLWGLLVHLLAFLHDLFHGLLGLAGRAVVATWYILATPPLALLCLLGVLLSLI